MSEKLKVTHEQAKAIEELKVNVPIYTQEIVESHIEGWLHHRRKCLNALKLDELLQALYVGYEVKPEYKEGQYVVHNHGDIRKIVKVGISSVEVSDGVDDFYWNKKHFRHATPEETKEEKERRWWKNHDREPWELKRGDLLSRDNAAYTVWNVKENGVTFNEFAIWKYWAELKEDFKVACFSDKREDVGDE